MPRLEDIIMDGWSFALETSGEMPERKAFSNVILPHDWAISQNRSKDAKQGAAQGYYERFGIGWYLKELLLKEKKQGHRYYLDFGGIFENSTIWVNGQEVGGHKYGYSSFRLDVTHAVEEGSNEIIVKVDNSASPADRWYSGCGIYRTVKFIELEEKHLIEEDVIVQTKVDKSDGIVTVTTGFDTGVLAQIEELNGTVICTSDNAEGGKITLTVPDAKLWSAEHPNLYSLCLRLMDGERIADEIRLRIGIRELKLAAGEGIFINGEKIILKGVCLHQDVGCRGIAAKEEIWRERLLSLKELGCNTIRPSHHTHSVEFMDLCDELGFYVYEEPFDKWKSGLYGRYFEDQWQIDVDCMIKRDRNRPSVIIWGVGNEVENQGQDSMVQILKMLTDYVRSVDTTRPVTYAMNPHFKRESNVDLSKIKDIQKFVDEVDDREITELEEKLDCICKIAEHVDIISCNYQEQWYPQIHKRIPKKLILGTEVYQYFKGHPDMFQNFSEENPSLVPFQLPYVIGSIIWTGIDYLGESMGYPSKGWSGSLIRTNGERRPSYYMLQSYWSDKPMIHFSVLDYTLEDEFYKEHWGIPPYVDHWHFPQFSRMVIPYMIASNCERVELFVNEKQYHVPKPNQCPNNMITGFIPYVAGRVEVVGYIGDEKVCSHVLKTPGTAVKLAFEKEEICVKPEAGYEMLLTISAVDGEGTPVVREHEQVRFRVEGPAQILGVDNGRLTGIEPYNAKEISLYQGKASVLIRLTGEEGAVKVYGNAAGMYEGRTMVSVVKNTISYPTK